MKRGSLNTIFGYLLLCFVFLWFVFPLFWILSTATKQENEYHTVPPMIVSEHPTLRHFRDVFVKGVSPLKNSLIAVACSSVLSIFLGLLAAYGLTRIKTGWRDKYTMWIISLRLFPPMAMMLPLFLLMRNLRLLDTYWSLIFVYTVFNLPFSVWMLRAFLDEIPYEIDECAMLDGCSHLRILFKILLPISKTGIITTAIFCSIFSWNEFLMATILTRSATRTFIVYAASFKSEQSINFGEIAAVIIIGTIPIIILYLFTKKQFVKGMSWGAVKE